MARPARYPIIPPRKMSTLASAIMTHYKSRKCLMPWHFKDDFKISLFLFYLSQLTVTPLDQELVLVWAPWRHSPNYGIGKDGVLSSPNQHTNKEMIYLCWRYLSHKVTPSSYFQSHGCFRSKRFAAIEHVSTAANKLLRICDVNIRIAFAFAGSTDRVLVTFQRHAIESACLNI